MIARPVVGVCGLAVLTGVAVYLLFQVPAAFAIGGIVALVAIFAAVSNDALDRPEAP